MMSDVPTVPAEPTRVPDPATPTPRLSRSAWILLWALLQGICLWALAHFGPRLLAWPATLLSLVTLAQTLPLTMQLLAQYRARRLLWGLAVALALLLAAASWSAIRNSGAPTHGYGSSDQAALWMRLLQPACWFVLLPFIEQRLGLGVWARNYARLFDRAWQFAFSLIVAGIFLGLFWLILWLLAGLFNMLGVTFFAHLFASKPFVSLATPLAGGLGLALCAAWEDRLSGYWRATLSVLGWLLPLVGAVALLFVCALPVRGLEPLWKTGYASKLMMTLMGALVFLFNVAWSDGAPEHQRFDAWLRRFVNLALLTLPVCAALTGWALYLRVAQYGWSAQRVRVALVAGLLAVYAVGYAAAALASFSPRRITAAWMALARRVNVGAAWLALALALLTCTPLLNPERIMIASQVARLLSQRVAVDQFDYAMLNMHGGRAGHAALERLAHEHTHPQAAEIRRRAALVLSGQSADADDAALPGQTGFSVDELRARLTPYPANVPLDADWLAFVVQEMKGADSNGLEWVMRSCTRASPCPVLRVDLRGDGRTEIVLLGGESYTPVFARRSAPDGAWYAEGRLGTPGHDPTKKELVAALAKGYATPAPRWRDLKIGNTRYQMHPDTENDN